MYKSGKCFWIHNSDKENEKSCCTWIWNELLKGFIQICFFCTLDEDFLNSVEILDNITSSNRSIVMNDVFRIFVYSVIIEYFWYIWKT